MTGYALLYFFSNILFLGAILQLTNILMLRNNGKTLFNQSYKKGTDEYKRVIRIASNKHILITGIVVLIFGINLVNAIRLIQNLDTDSAQFILIFAPLASIGLFLIMINWAKSIYGTSQKNKS